MAMTAQVKAELASTKVTKSCCRKAEVSSMLRFAGATSTQLSNLSLRLHGMYWKGSSLNCQVMIT